MPTQIKSLDAFEAAIKKSNEDKKVMIVKFGASWCKPCKDIAPCWHSLETKYADMQFVEIDYDDDEDIIDDYKIKKLPTFIVIKDGKENDRLPPAREPEEALKEFVSKQFQGAVENAFSLDVEF